jgi:hypothetical protein
MTTATLTRSGMNFVDTLPGLPAAELYSAVTIICNHLYILNNFRHLTRD